LTESSVQADPEKETYKAKIEQQVESLVALALINGLYSYEYSDRKWPNLFCRG
jgi:hypothetical protein